MRRSGWRLWLLREPCAALLHRVLRDATFSRHAVSGQLTDWCWSAGLAVVLVRLGSLSILAASSSQPKSQKRHRCSQP